MIRLGLLLFLVLETAVGPGLCCCVATWADFCADAKGGNFCCQGKYPGKGETPNQRQVPACPCQNERGTPILLKVGDWDQNVSDFRCLGAVDDINQTVTVFVPEHSQATSVSRNLAFTFLDGRGILRAIHVLLC